MAKIILPTPPRGVYRWLLRYQLEAVFYRFLFRWNTRDAYWYLDVGSDINVSQVRGIKLNLGIDKLYKHKTSIVPPGSLDVVDSTNTDTQPTLSSFGGRVLLTYTDSVSSEVVVPELNFVPSPPT
jgi:hypothetical protein